MPPTRLAVWFQGSRPAFGVSSSLPTYHRNLKATIYSVSFGIWLWRPSSPATRILLSIARRMSDQPSRDTSFEVVRSQPQPSMSTTSSQYRNTAQTPSHYPDFPTANHDPLYGLATWQQDAAAVATHDSYAVGPSTASFLHYPQPGVDSASLHAVSTPSAWAAGYVRQQAPNQWQEQQQQQQPEETYRSRASVSYCDTEGTAPVPLHQLPAISRHYQQQQQQQHHPHHHHHQSALNAAPTLPLTAHDHGFQSTDRFHQLRISSVSAHKDCCALH